MSHVEKNQPEGTPTWIDLGIPDLDQAMEFYRALFGWEYEVGPAEAGHYTICLLDGRGVAALAPNPDPQADAFWWNVYFAADDCDRTSERVLAAGGELIMPPMDVMEQGRMAIARDPVGAQFGLWQGRNRIGCETVNEPGALVRNDLITANPGPARDFYAAVFDFSLDGNPDLPDFDFTFLRRPDGHEIGGIMGVSGCRVLLLGHHVRGRRHRLDAGAAAAHGGQAGAAEDFIYGRLATITDPFGTEFSVITRPAAGTG